MAWSEEKYHFDRYVSQQRSNCIESNSCDYKGTSDHELDGITQRLFKAYVHMVAMRGELTDKQLTQLHAYAKVQNDKTHWRNRQPIDEWSDWIGDDHQWWCGPRWMSYYQEFKNVTVILEVVK